LYKKVSFGNKVLGITNPVPTEIVDTNSAIGEENKISRKSRLIRKTIPTNCQNYYLGAYHGSSDKRSSSRLQMPTKKPALRENKRFNSNLFMQSTEKPMGSRMTRNSSQQRGIFYLLFQALSMQVPQIKSIFSIKLFFLQWRIQIYLRNL
jgi:hypothetical protein